MILPLLFFMTDIIIHALFFKTYLSLLWAFFIVQIFLPSPALFFLSYVLLALQGVIFHATPAPHLIVTTIFALFGYYSSSFINIYSPFPYIFTALLSIVTLHSIFALFFNQTLFSLGFTIYFLCANIIVVILLLKFFAQGKLGSR